MSLLVFSDEDLQSAKRRLKPTQKAGIVVESLAPGPSPTKSLLLFGKASVFTTYYVVHHRIRVTTASWVSNGCILLADKSRWKCYWIKRTAANPQLSIYDLTPVGPGYVWWRSYYVVYSALAMNRPWCLNVASVICFTTVCGPRTIELPKIGKVPSSRSSIEAEPGY